MALTGRVKFSLLLSLKDNGNLRSLKIFYIKSDFEQRKTYWINLETSIDAVRKWQAGDSVAVFCLVEVTRWVKLNSGL